MKPIKTLAVLVAVALLAGCAGSQKASTFQTGQVQQQMKVSYARVLEVRVVDIDARPSGAGSAAGAAIGGVAGSTMGQGRGSVVGAIGGAVLGGVLGTMADRSANSKKGVEIVYQPENSNETLALVQEVDDENPIQRGDRIRIMQSYNSVRAVRVQR